MSRSGAPNETASRPSMSGFVVLFHCHYAQPLRDTIVPLAHELQNDSGVSTRVVLEAGNIDEMEEICVAAGLPCRVVVDDHARFARLARLFKKPPRLPAAEKLSALGSSVKEDARKPLRRALRQARIIQAKIERAASVLREEKAAVLVVLDDRTYVALYWIQAAELCGIPTVFVQWAAFLSPETQLRLKAGRSTETERAFEDIAAEWLPHASRMLGDDRVWWIPPEQAVAFWVNDAFPRVDPWVVGGGNTDAIAVFGEFWKRLQLGCGVSERKIVVTGHPEHDRWFRLRAEWSPTRRREELEELGIEPTRRVITLISPAFSLRAPGGIRTNDMTADDLQQDLREAVATIARVCPKATIVFKCHPRDYRDESTFTRSLERSGVRVVRQCSLERLLAASDAVLLQWSTTAMMALAVGTPVVAFDFRASPSASLWKDAQGVRMAETPFELGAELKAVLAPELNQSFIEDREASLADLIRFDGLGSRRLVELISEYAKGGRSAAGR
jgi:hypothetical protein